LARLFLFIFARMQLSLAFPGRNVCLLQQIPASSHPLGEEPAKVLPESLDPSFFTHERYHLFRLCFQKARYLFRPHL
jgi:hypothetical protein